MQAAQRHSAEIEKLCGVSGAQLWLMQELKEASELRVGEIAARLMIHQTTASNLLNSLEKRGYVLKKQNKHDMRVVTVSLSVAGRKVLKCAPLNARGILVESLKKLEKKQLLEFERGIDAMLNAIEVADISAGQRLLSFMTSRTRRSTTKQ